MLYGGGGSFKSEPLVSVQHSEICSQPQFLYWFVINCTIYNVVHRGGVCGGGHQNYDLFSEKVRFFDDFSRKVYQEYSLINTIFFQNVNFMKK